MLMAFSLFSCKDKYTIPDKIAESVVIVNSSSGIVVYSDDSKSLILTAYHVVAESIKKAACSGCEEYGVEVKYLYVDYTDDEGPEILFEKYSAINIDFNDSLDLAIIEIHPERKLWHSNIAISAPRLGDSIWLGANPNFNYRSLKQGIVSATERIIGMRPFIEVSGGIIFGSSGGGAFNKSGELFGIIHSVDAWRSPFCYPVIDEEGNVVDFQCVAIPMTDIGYVSETYIIHGFLSKSPYSKYFDYLN